MPQNKYTLSISLSILNHLGLNLYSNIPAVLSEAIANAWDADAHTVKVDFNTRSGTITIRDDGDGMNQEDINNKYLYVGYRKRAQQSVTALGRKPMGRKGIGKLSLFSIADKIYIYSLKKNAEPQALLLDADKIREAIEDKDRSSVKEYNPEEIAFDVDINTHGTIIRLANLKKSIISRTSDSLRKRIARRFGIIGDETGFQVYLDNVPVKMTDRDYFDKARFLFQYGPDKTDQYCLHLDDDSQTQGKAVFTRPHKFDVDGRPDDAGPFEVSGWIGIARHSNDLDGGNDDENLNRITVMVRGKVAQEDILQEYRLGGMITKFMFGEVRADFLDEDGKEDIATSGRQRILEDDERYLALKKFIERELRHIWTRTNQLKERRGMETAMSRNPAVREWYETLSPVTVKKAAQKVFGALDQAGIDESYRNDFYANAILAVETLKMRVALEYMEDVNVENVEQFLKYLGDIDAIEAEKYREIVQERIRVIRKLRESVEENARERLLQEYIFEHLWLLDPAWERATQYANMEETVQTSIGGSTKTGRIDIRYKRVMAGNVIVELKRSGVRTRKTDLEEQVKVYMSAVRKNLRQRGHQVEPLSAVCIVGKLPVGWEDEEERRKDEESLRSHSIRVVTYDELIDSAYSAYSKFVSEADDVDKLRRLIDRVRGYVARQTPGGD